MTGRWKKWPRRWVVEILQKVPEYHAFWMLPDEIGILLDFSWQS